MIYQARTLFIRQNSSTIIHLGRFTQENRLLTQALITSLLSRNLGDEAVPQDQRKLR